MSLVTNLIEQLLNGLTLGMVYVLLAAGLSIIFGVMNVINFSHGELFALGAYFALAIVNPLGPETGFWVALVLAPILVGIVGGVLERFTIRPLYGRNPLYHILLTFGLVLVLNDLIHLIWGPQQHLLPTPAALNQPITAAGITLSTYNVFMIVVGGVVAVGTWLLLNRTKYGMIVRAGSEDRQMVRNVGINIDRYYTLVFAFGAALAALAGVVLGGYQNVNPGMGNSVIIPAFIVVVLGGLGSFRGAVYGGLFLGVVRVLSRTYAPFFEGITMFVLMIAVLLLKPQGLFGDSESGHSSESGDLLTGTNGGVLSPETRAKLGLGLVGALAVAPVVLNALGQTYYVTLLNDIFIWALFALSLDIIMGYTGLVPLGHTMFYGVGAYAAGLTMLHITPSILVAVVVAMAFCAVLALVVGALSTRVSGIYFAMVTLAFAELLYNLVFKLEFTGGSNGLLGFDPFFGIAGIGAPMADIELTVAGFLVTPTVVFYYLVLGICVASYLVSRRLMSAPFGRVLQAIGESEERTTFLGYDVTSHKRRAFAISGTLAGLSGSLLAISPNTFVISPGQTLAWVHSGDVIVMTLLGGMGTLFGPMLGAGFFIGAENLLTTYTEYWQLVIGTVFIVFVIFVPRGLVSIPSLVVRHVKRRRGGSTAAVSDSEADTDD